MKLMFVTETAEKIKSMEIRVPGELRVRLPKHSGIMLQKSVPVISCLFGGRWMLLHKS